MTRREQCEQIIAAVESAGLDAGPLGGELRALWTEIERLREGIRRHTVDMDGLAREIGIWGSVDHSSELYQMYEGLRALLEGEK